MANTVRKLECQVCGATFTVVDHADGSDEIPNVQAFLSRHRRCVQRVLERGGALAKPAYRRD